MYIIYGLTVVKFKLIGEECISPPVVWPLPPKATLLIIRSDFRCTEIIQYY